METSRIDPENIGNKKKANFFLFFLRVLHGFSRKSNMMDFLENQIGNFETFKITQINVDDLIVFFLL